MTTIAYRDGILAGDTRLTSGDAICDDRCKKVFKLRDGSLYGSSGDGEAGEMLMAALRKGILLPSLPKEPERGIEAIRVTADGAVWFFGGYIWSRQRVPFITIGSGHIAAMAVLRYGGSAVDAVKAGIASDVHSGGRVQSVRLESKKRG